MSGKLQNILKSKSNININGCWIWNNKEDSYGRLTWEGKRQGVHRWSFIAFKGTIPEGFEIDHLCRVPGCVNPEHLEAVSSKENTLRGQAPSAINSAKILCVNGHPLFGKNSYIDVRGWRVCRNCARERARNKYWKHRQTKPSARMALWG